MTIVTWIALALLAGCPSSHDLDDGGDRPDGGRPPMGRDAGDPPIGRDAGPGRMDAGRFDAGPIEPPCDEPWVVRGLGPEGIERLDLLVVMDNSNSMAEEQASFALELPRLVRVLATGDTDDDGIRELPPVSSLQIGVVSTDMGTGGFRVPTCREPTFGDDGVLSTRGNTAIPGCMATYPSFLTFRPGDDDPDRFTSDVDCVTRMGTGGCGFEQPLEAALKAVTPSSSAITFVRGTTGHADGANAGFVRDDSLLVVVLLSDEDDCSASDPELFNPSSARYSGDLNLRCFQYPEAVHPVDRFVAGLLAAKDDPSLLVFSAIVGAPTDLVGDAAGIDYDAILDDPRMQERIDPTMPTLLVPSCSVPGRGVAFPPRRIVTTARRLEERGAGATVASICQASLSGALDATLARLADGLDRECLPRRVDVETCELLETLPASGPITRCEQVADRGRDARPADIDRAGRQVCRVRRTPGPGTGEPGWYYLEGPEAADRCPETRARIGFEVIRPVTGALVRLECTTGGDCG